MKSLCGGNIFQRETLKKVIEKSLRTTKFRVYRHKINIKPTSTSMYLQETVVDTDL